MNRKRSFPTNPNTRMPIRDVEQPGYYPGFSTLGQQKQWDKTTRDVVVKRVSSEWEIRFFNPSESALLQAIIERLIPQDDRTDERTISILPVIDERLYKNELNGFRYEDMPPDRDAYHLGLRAITEMADERFHQPFVELDVYCQELLLKSLHDGQPDPAHPIWKQMPVHRFWGLLMEDCVTAYYSHPWAWDEIGFGGPAYPRAYMRLENGLPEPWEKDEARYEWAAPADSVSEIDMQSAPPEHASLQGHEGAH